MVFNKMEISEQILGVMSKSGKPLRCGELSELSGIEKAVVDKNLKKLQKDGIVISPVRCYYEIKK